VAGEKKKPVRRAKRAAAAEPAPLPTPQSEFLAFVLKTLEEKRSEAVVRLDVSRVTDIADEFIIATVLNPRQAAAVLETIEKERKRMKLSRLGIDRDQKSTWIVLDYGWLVIHLQTPEARAYYDLEHLWADARRV
jgi:ribosome-associated protein